jgi:hypothetical protein
MFASCSAAGNAAPKSVATVKGELTGTTGERALDSLGDRQCHMGAPRRVGLGERSLDGLRASAHGVAETHHGA